ncbi:outer membrane receptor for ferrienterochelin and colicins [Natronospira proteinivora]|uniref:Outer membrane receptor for ferrienterochelin and colicins n=1 Tax=Natronospira proteinivora TaxID=1807133 RepID=A0ABT1GAD0_9GAMM|nr:TonB-dependent receptor [Natronospira proteinivora]MCP1727208.1 outer membrane receptor for ferrienterochelin and colicins [Natronospira proteinivora]
MPYENRRFITALACAGSFLAPGPVLADAGAELDSIVVTATRSEQPQAEAPAGTTVISRQQIEALSGAGDLNDILRQVPGISVQGEGREGRSTVRVRGLEGEHTLFLVDGRRMPNTDAAFAHSDFRSRPLPLSAIERIEVIRGPMSGLYGADAMGGVINIITRRPTDAGAAGEGSLRLGTAERGGNEARLDTALGLRDSQDRALLLAFEGNDRAASPHPDRLGDEVEARRDQVAIADLQLPLGRTQNLGFRARAGLDDRDFQNAPGDTREQEVRQSELGISWDGDFGGTHLAFDAYDSTSRLERTSDPDHQPRRLGDQVGEGRIIQGWGMNQTLTAGMEYRRETLSDPNNLPDEESAEHRRLYFQNASRFMNDRLLVTAGATHLNHSRFDAVTSPRVSASWGLSEGWHVKGAYGEAFSTPQLHQLSEDYLSIGIGRPFDIIGNPDLEPETSEGMEVGLIREGNTFQAGVVLFRNNIEQLIETTCIENCEGPPTVGPARIRQYVNVDRARTEGSELFFQYRLSAEWEVEMNHTYLRAKDLDTDERLNGRPRHNVHARIGWQPLDNLGFDIDARYTGPQQFDGDDAPGYTLLGLRSRGQLSDAWRWAAGVENLADIRLESRSPTFNYTERGRFLFGRLTYRFGG